MLGIAENSEHELGGIHSRDHHQVSFLVGPVFVINVLEGFNNIGLFQISDVEVEYLFFNHVQDQFSGLLAAATIKITFGAGAKEEPFWILS